ncbi:hypothetical protein KUTeg_005779 [Tegillarca granosa]|uniref:Uncharacterized protein n=1 Tax=Tegillarca granosa TaxID=220873 RepID=A0ABQ9FH88_TEGGR|nr:hypothetical protein KUTeg_005779 [Tegillarca granosa]
MSFSDETAKFIWYIMKEAGVEMPSFTSIKNIRFGDLAPESLLGQGEGNDGTPCWFIKPSQLLKMAVSHLKTSNDLISSNKSKRWRPLHCLQLQFSGLPVAVRQDQHNIKFLAASSDIEIFVLLKYIVQDLYNLKRNRITAYAKTSRDIVVTSALAICVCDFNMMAEASNHLRPNTNKFCLKCNIDRSDCINKGEQRNSTVSRGILERLQLSGSKELRQRHDIPVSMLHWMFLGIGKHLLKVSFESLPENGIKIAECLIESLDQTSFKEKINKDLIRYIDSRQGKDIKHYIQIAPYHLRIAGLSKRKVKLLCMLAEICRLLSTKKEFQNQEILMIKNKIDNYLPEATNVYPSLLQKVKTHLSTHTTDDIIQHGPPCAYFEDGFEKAQ